MSQITALTVPKELIPTQMLGKMFSNVKDFDENLSHLENSLTVLNASKEDVIHRIEAQLLRKSLKVVKVWLKNVDEATEKSQSFIQRVKDQNRVRNCLTRIIDGGNLAKMLKRVDCLSDTRFRNTCGHTLPTRDKMPLPRHFVRFQWYNEVLPKVLDKDKNLIGILGAKGIGASTFLRYISEELCHKYWTVLFISSSTVEDMQLEIARKLELDCLDRSSTDRCSLIHRATRNKEFAIILDGLRCPIKLEEIGLVLTGRKKVIFSTMNQDICDVMEVDFLHEIGPPTDTDLWNFLCEKVGVKDKTKEPAEEIMRIIVFCKRNLKLVSLIGRAMKGRIDIDEWRSVSSALVSSTGMKSREGFDEAENMYIHACQTEICPFLKMDQGLSRNLKTFDAIVNETSTTSTSTTASLL